MAGILMVMFYGLPVLLLITPLFLRRWPWLFLYAAVVGGALMALQIDHLMKTSRPDYQDGGGGAGFGEAMFSLWKFGFCSGLALRIIEALLRWAVKIRRTSVFWALSVALLATAFSFSFLSFFLVVLPNWQWHWLIGRHLLKFMQSWWPYFAVFWAVTSIGLIAFPYMFPRSSSRS